MMMVLLLLYLLLPKFTYFLLLMQKPWKVFLSHQNHNGFLKRLLIHKILFVVISLKERYWLFLKTTPTNCFFFNSNGASPQQQATFCQHRQKQCSWQSNSATTYYVKNFTINSFCDAELIYYSRFDDISVDTTVNGDDICYNVSKCAINAVLE